MSPSLKPTAVPATSPALSARVSVLTGTTAKAETTPSGNDEYVTQYFVLCVKVVIVVVSLK